MFRVGVCDDEKMFADMVSAILRNYFGEKGIETVINKYINPTDFIQSHITSPYDIVFLDIDMPGFSGFELSKTIRDLRSDTQIVYVTSKEELVFQSFDYQPFYFICKQDRIALQNKIERVLDSLMKIMQLEHTVQINDSVNGISFVRIKDILYLKSTGHYSEYYIKDGNILKERVTLSDALAKLPDTFFVRTHQRYIIGLVHIKQFEAYLHTVRLTSGNSLPVSRSFYASAYSKFIEYKRG